MIKRRIKFFLGLLIIGKSYKYLSELDLWVLILNRWFKFFFQLNRSTSELFHFTSTVIHFSKISYQRDRHTLSSFAVSGGCYIQAINGIVIGSNFLFAHGLKLISANHDPEKPEKWLGSKPIIIGNNVWAGTNVVILPGVAIPDNCVIGAGSIVTKSFDEEGIVIAGNPAKRIKKI